ncbi:MAG: DUF736 domain-containing protein [Pseudomonadota bacterium]
MTPTFELDFLFVSGSQSTSLLSSCRVTWPTFAQLETAPSKKYPRCFAAPRGAYILDGAVLHSVSPAYRFKPVKCRPFGPASTGAKGLQATAKETKRNILMANALGYVSETKSGFEGALSMMNLSATIRIERNGEKESEGQPDYRIFAGETSTEIGGGWVRKAKNSGRDYVSITLADPQIGPRKIFANLAPLKGQDGRHVILWNPRD